MDESIKKWLYGSEGPKDVPEVGSKYFYVRGCMVKHCHVVVEAQWHGSVTDALRMSKGNCYPTAKDAEECADVLNGELARILTEMGRREAERKKREKPADVRIRTPKQRAKSYGRRVKQHPDLKE